MRKLVEKIKRVSQNKRRMRRVFGDQDWMKLQLLRMTELNQELVRMSVGR